MMDITIELKNDKLCLNFQGKEKLLKAHSKTLFSSENIPKVEFYLNERNRPMKIKMLTSDGRIMIFDYDTGPEDLPGPEKESWKQFFGYYRTFFIDLTPLYSTFYTKKGYFTQFTTIDNKEYKLEEKAEGLFFTADGQSIEFKDELLFTPTSIWEKFEPSIDELKLLLESESDNILVSKNGLEELMTILDKTKNVEKVSAIKNLITQYYLENSLE